MQDQGQRSHGFDSILELWSRRKRLGLVVFAAVVTGVASIAMCLPNMYRATATVLVERQDISETFVRPSVSGELDTRLQTISQEILSRGRLEDLITRLDLYPNTRKRAPLEAIVGQVRKDIQLELKGVEKTGGRNETIAFTLTYRGRDPEEVARVANMLATSYVEENLRLRERQAANTAEFLKTQVLDAKRGLDEQERRVNEFKQQDGDAQPERVMVSLAILERMYTQLHLNAENQARAEDRRDRLVKELAAAPVSRQTGVPDTSELRLAKLRQGLAELRARYTDQHPSVIRAKEETAALERQLAQKKPEGTQPAAAPTDPALHQLSEDSRKIDAELTQLRADEQRLRQSIAIYEQRLENTPKRQGELQQAMRDYGTTKDLYDSLLKRYQDAQLAESVERQKQGERFRILDAALPPKAPTAPDRKRLIIMGLVLALGLAAGVVVGAERADTSFHSARELRSFTRVPVLVSIPRIVTRADVRRRRRRFCLGMLAALAALVLIVGASYYVASGNEQLVWMLSRGGS